jgi:CYTH domain-containing protein
VEIELSDENESIEFPPQLKVICEVTDDPEYKNARIAAL